MKTARDIDRLKKHFDKSISFAIRKTSDPTRIRKLIAYRVVLEKTSTPKQIDRLITSLVSFLCK